MDASVNDASHGPSAGTRSAKNSKFDGFAIGSTKLAAFATSAHANTYACGRASVRATASSTAGVSTTIVASFDRNAVVTTPAPYTSNSSREREPRAACTARVAIHANTPS